MFRKIVKISVSVIAVLLVATVQTAYARAGAEQVRLSAIDTVAHFETLITAEGLSANSVARFNVLKPDGSHKELQGRADASGTARVTFPDTETTQAGVYQVRLVGYGAAADFRVFPGEVDDGRSALYSSKAAVKSNGADFATVTVRIVDEFGNPLEFHEVSLVSSRSSDRISAVNGETDASGLSTFSVSSREPGVSAFTATDGSGQTIIKQRLKIIFVKSETVFKDIGGDPETILLAQAGQTVSRFIIDNMPAAATVNETVSFRVKAVDAVGNVVPSYTGRIIFTSTDNNSTRPGGYTFQSADQGQKTFDLGLSFRTVGSQKLFVEQDGNSLIKGEKTVEVTAASSGSASGQVRITKPATGTYSLNVLEVAGEATPNARVKIFDNGQQITEVSANTSGRFTFNTSLLRDGQHTFHAESNGVQSVPVTINIDSTPARVQEFDISKTNLAPGDTAQLTIRSDPDLNSVQATVGEVIINLEPDPGNPGVYRGMITAPVQKGDYTINVIIVDKLGNAGAPEEVGKITVDPELSVNPTSSFSVPSKVQGVVTAPGNGRITLVWQPAQAESGIAFYRIYYGTNVQQLNLIANTKDSATTWYIPNLQNDTQYYFRVVGVDAKGNEGDNLSDLASATPSISAGGGDDGQVLCDPDPCPVAPPPPVTPEDGPEVWGMVVAALMGTPVMRMLMKRRSK